MRSLRTWHSRSVGLLSLTAMLTALVIPSGQALAQEVRRTSGGYEVQIEHRYDTNGTSRSFYVDNYAGDIEVTGADDNEVIVTETVTVDADNENEARERGLRYLSDVSLSSERIMVRGSMHHGENLKLRVRLATGIVVRVSSIVGDISLDRFDGHAELETGSGDIDVRHLEASLEVRTGAGDIDVLDAQGPLMAISGAGNVSLENIGGATDAATGAGDLTLKKIVGRMELATGGGDIDVVEAEGSVVATSAGGDIQISDITGNAELSTSGGSIEVRRLTGDLAATTLGGDVEGDRVIGSVTAETMAGDIDFLHVTNQIVATSEVGEISVRVEDAAFLTSGIIDLRAENGDIELRIPNDTSADVYVDLGFDGTLDKRSFTDRLRWTERNDEVRGGRARRVTGTLNQGGGRIELRTTSGDISVIGE